jgi:hypothetical protein
MMSRRCSERTAAPHVELSQKRLALGVRAAAGLEDRLAIGRDAGVEEKRMGQGISEVLTFAIGVAISPVPIIAVILMLFSRRAKVNGPMFLLGWMLALTIVSVVAYFISDQSNASTPQSRAASKRNSTPRTAAFKRWCRPSSFKPAKAFAFGALLAGVHRRTSY